MKVAILVASVASDESVFALVASLSPQLGPGDRCVIADRVGGSHRARLHQLGGPMVIVEAPPETSVPALRALALDRADAPVVIVVEDHCVVTEGWLTALVAPLENKGVVLSAGPVRDALRGDSWDRAAFLCDYAPFLSGAAPGSFPGMNTAYRAEMLREALAAVAEEDAFWEGPVHRRLALRGKRAWAPDAVIDHRKHFSPRLGAQQRYLQGRHHAGLRARGLAPGLRAAWAIAGLALLPVLASRTASHAARAGLLRAVLRAGPQVLALHAAGVVGEAVGTTLGPGDAAGRIV